MKWFFIILYFAIWTVPAKFILWLYGEAMLRICFRNKIYLRRLEGVLIALLTQTAIATCGFICGVVIFLLPFLLVMDIKEESIVFLCYSFFWFYFWYLRLHYQYYEKRYGLILNLSGERERAVVKDDSSPGKEAALITMAYHMKEFRSLKAKTREDIATYINIIIKNCSTSKKISGDRIVYWEKYSKIIVILDPASVYKGVAFRLADGEDYFNSLR